MNNVKFSELSYDELVSHVESAVTALRQRAYYEGYQQGRFDEQADAPTPKFTPITPQELREKTAQEVRDEIVEMAKRDVAELSTTWRPGCPSLNYPLSAFDPSTETVNFEINNEKRTVVCFITYWSDLHNRIKTSFRGIAKCAPSDCFNVHIGKAIALRRALGLEVPAEYLNAPQPTEVRVGDIVEWFESSEVYEIIGRKGFDYKFRDIRDGWESGYLYYDDLTKAARIIDDSRGDTE